MGVDQECFVKGDNISDHLICKICFLVLEIPVKLGNCVHYFCKGCIRDWFARYRTCPTCRAIQQQVNVEVLSRQPDPLLVNLLDDEERYCSQRDEKCYWTGPSHRLQAHLADDCLVQQSSRKDDEVRRLKQQLEEMSSSKDDEIRSLRQQLKEVKLRVLRQEDELNSLKAANQEKSQNSADGQIPVSATPGYNFSATASGAAAPTSTPLLTEAAGGVDPLAAAAAAAAGHLPAQPKVQAAGAPPPAPPAGQVCAAEQRAAQAGDGSVAVFAPEDLFTRPPRGLFQWMGTRGWRAEYKNPQGGLCRLTSSPVMQGVIDSVIVPENTSTCMLEPGGGGGGPAGAWVCLDLGRRRALCPAGVLLHGAGDGQLPWLLEGSADGESYSQLSTAMAPNGGGRIYLCNAHNRQFRYLRVRSADPSAFLDVTMLDFAGKLFPVKA